MDINAWLESTVRNLRHSMRVLANDAGLYDDSNIDARAWYWSQ